MISRLPIILLAIATLAAAPAPPATRPELPWGTPDTGVQCAIVPGAPGPVRFAAGQRVEFTAAIRNVSGPADLFVVRSQVTCMIELDGRWFHYFGNVEAKSSSLPPGTEYRDIEIWLDADWAAMDDGPRFKLGPGKHVLRIAVEAQNEQQFEPVVRPVSQTVEFEVAP
jgi:hypothetical protein